MNTISSFFQLFFVVIICFSITAPLFSQAQRLEFNIGSGPSLDAIHGGFNFKFSRKVEFGLSLGTIPDKFDFNNHVKIGFETKYNFGESKTIKRRVEMEDRRRSIRINTWYAGLRMQLVTDTQTRDTEEKFVYITPAIGRHCNFNKSMGFNIDFGLALTANQTTTYSGNLICRECFLEEHPQYPVRPTLRIQFFVKI